MNEHQGGPRWYALQVQHRYEFIAGNILCNKGFRVLAPAARVRRHWSDRIVEVEQPLFPGYVFCQFDVNNRTVPVLTTPGVIRAVGIGKNPYPIDDHEMESIEEVVTSKVGAEPHPYVTVGTRVCVKFGALAGLEGIVTKVKNQHRLVLSISLIQRSVAVEIDEAWIDVVSSDGPRRVYSA